MGAGIYRQIYQGHIIGIDLQKSALVREIRRLRRYIRQLESRLRSQGQDSQHDNRGKEPSVREMPSLKLGCVELVEWERRYRELYEGSRDGWAMVDGKGCILECNSAFLKMLGYTLEEIRSLTYRDITPEQWHDLEERILTEQVRTRGYSDVYEKEYRRKGGSVFPVELRTYLTRSHDDSPDLVWAFVRDITERKFIEMTLRDSEERFRSLIDSTSDWIWEVDARCVYTYVSPQVEGILGYKPGEVFGKTPFDFMPLEEAERVRAIFQECDVKRESIVMLENVNLHKEGHCVVLETSGSPIIDRAGKVCGYRGVDRDITKRKQVEERLMEARAFTDSLIQTAHVLIVGLDRDGNVQVFNRAAENITGYKKSELVGKNWFEVLAPKERYPEVWKEFGRLLANGLPSVFENPILTKEGQERTISWSNSEIQLGSDGVGIVSFGIDVTDRKQAEASYRQKQEQFRRLVDNIPGVTYRCALDMRWTMQFISNEIEILCGYPPTDFINNRKRSFLSIIHPDDRGRVNQTVVKKVKDKEPFMLEYRIVHADRSIHWVYERGRSVLDDRGRVICLDGVIMDITPRKKVEEALAASEEKFRAIFETSREGILIIDLRKMRIILANPSMAKMCEYPQKEMLALSIADLHPHQAMLAVINEFLRMTHRESGHIVELPVLKKDGGLFYADISCSPIRIDGHDCLVECFRDVTDRRRALEERQQRHIDVAHKQRLNTIGQMVSTLSHELNQPLCAVMMHAEGCLRMIENRTWDTNKLLKKLDTIARQSEYAGKVIARIRDFVKKGKRVRMRCNLNDVIREAVCFFEMECRHQSIQIGLDLADDLGPVEMDAVQIEQVLLNLIQNGLEAMQAVPVSHRRLRIRSMKQGNCVTVSVTDGGVGFVERDLDSLFEAFHTTKVDGLGIGLSISQSIIESHGGQLTGHANIDRGVTFTFTLPTVEP